MPKAECEFILFQYNAISPLSLASFQILPTTPAFFVYSIFSLLHLPDLHDNQKLKPAIPPKALECFSLVVLLAGQKHINHLHSCA
jgi:hypothetical protein